MTVPPELFIRGMRQLAAGVTIVTTAAGGRLAGLTATSVCSVSAEPPQLLACINRRAEAHPLLEASGVFALNLLTKHQQPLAEVFAGITGVFGEARFAHARWATLATGAPILTPCVAAFDCRVVAAVPAATHTVFIGRVEALAIRPELEPLVYVEGDYGMVIPLPEQAEEQE